MNTAVPGTRTGGRAASDFTKSSGDSAPSRNRELRMKRPLRHVVISVKTTPAMTSGNHPPSTILKRFATRNDRSGMRNAIVIAPAVSRLQPRRSRATTYASTVVMIIVMLTATPYAPARFDELRKPRTSAIVATITLQFTAGM